MGTLLMALNIIANEAESMIVRQRGRKQAHGGFFFNAIICLFAAVFFIVTDKNSFAFPKELLPYGIASCIFYAGGFYFLYVALSEGSFVGSKMLSAASVLIPVCYGILFLGEAAKPATYAAIVLMILSVFMQVYKKGEDEAKKNSSAKWIVWALLSAICNGFIIVVTRSQQIKFSSAYDNEFMIFSLLGAFAFLITLTLIKEPGMIKKTLKHDMLYGIAAGALNGTKNFLNLLILLYFPVSVSTPLKTVLGYILSFLISAFLYKEPFTKLKLAGILTGVISVILFTI